MIRRILLQNYMSHEETVLEPAAGLTVLAGPNNCGKSAVVYALQTLCYNARGDYMVRHGARECRVVIETDDGHRVEWQRRGNVVCYVVDGKETHRPGADFVEEMQALLKLPQVASEDGQTTFDIHFGEQKSPIFLLDQSAGKRAVFFASSSDAAKLMKMQQANRDNVQQAQREEKRLAEEVRRAAALLEILAPVAALEKETERLEEEHHALRQGREQWAALAAAFQELDRQQLDHRRRRAVHQALLALRVPPRLRETGPLENLTRELDGARGRSASARNRIEVLVEMRSPPERRDTAVLEKLAAELRLSLQGFQVSQAKEMILAALQPPPAEWVDTAPVRRFLEEWRAAERARRDRAAYCRTLSALRPVPPPRETRELAKLARTLQDAAAAVQERRDGLREIASQADQAFRALEDWVRQNPLCPTCGARFDPQRLKAAGPCHA